MNPRLLFAAVLLSLLLEPLYAVADNPNDILIIANLGTKTSKISEDDLRNIFLKKRTTWNTGEKAFAVHNRNPQLRKRFIEKILQMKSLEAEQEYWAEQKIMHGTSEPYAFVNVLKAVFKLKGSVSYIYRSQYLEGVVKVVLVLKAK